MKKIDLSTWKRKEHFIFFSKMASPFFGIVTEIDCSECFKNSKEEGKSFFEENTFQKTKIEPVESKVTSLAEYHSKCVRRYHSV